MSFWYKEESRKRFIQMYETRVNEQFHYVVTGEQTSYWRIFELQAYAMARAHSAWIANN